MNKSISIVANALIGILIVGLVSSKASASERWIEGDIPNEAQLVLAAEYVKATRLKDINKLKAL